MSSDIKDALCRYFYEKRHCVYFCKEFFIHKINRRADFVAAFNEYEKCQKVWRVIEIEIKTSLADFFADFHNKSGKHRVYTGNASIPPCVNFFAFCVPLEIYDKCREFLNKNYPQYGLFVYDPYDKSVCQAAGSQFSQKKRLTTAESVITPYSIVKQMAINIVYKN